MIEKNDIDTVKMEHVAKEMYSVLQKFYPKDEQDHDRILAVTDLLSNLIVKGAREKRLSKSMAIEIVAQAIRIYPEKHAFL